MTYITKIFPTVSIIYLQLPLYNHRPSLQSVSLCTLSEYNQCDWLIDGDQANHLNPQKLSGQPPEPSTPVFRTDLYLTEGVEGLAIPHTAQFRLFYTVPLTVTVTVQLCTSVQWLPHSSAAHIRAALHIYLMAEILGTAQYNTVHTTRYCWLHKTEIYCAKLQRCTLHWTAELLQYKELHCTALHCTALHCTALPRLALHYIALKSIYMPYCFYRCLQPNVKE